MATNGTNEVLSKDEVGWYFVEQYYTTLSKNPSRLHLFYGKKSQLVYGNEAEVAAVSVGRQNIQDRITKLDFQDCKVRVSNVDSQASMDNILIQVIGEISNKSEDSRKFVQTFVLAEQQSGYFVLNDVFRYIKEEDDEATEAVEAAPAATEENKPVEAEETKAEDAASVKAEEVAAAKPQLDAAVVDKKLEEVSANTIQTPAVPAVSMPAEPVVPKAVVPAVPTVAPVATPAKAPEPEKVSQEVAEEEQETAEVPKEPTPTPVPAPAATPVPAAAPAPAAVAAPAEPEKPKAPPKPMTWASRAAAAAGPAKPVAVPKPAAAPAAAAAAPAAAPAAAAAAAPAAAAAAAPAKPTAAAAAPPPAASKAAESDASKDSGEWQTAGADSKRQNRPQSISGPPQEKDSALGYIKYVTDKVDEATLRSHLETFGPVVYFDISRTKNCAFIEFASPAGYQAAVAANPHTVNGENIVVEARRPKAGAYGGSNYNPNRGNLASRGRGGYEGRNGTQGGGRGGFGQNRGRGGPGAARGRGGAPGLAA